MPSEVIVLGASDVCRLLPVRDCIDALERAFATADPTRSFVAGTAAPSGKFHVKAALATVGRPLFAAKLNANFPDNPRAHGLPTIQGVLVLCDGEVGSPLAIMDSASITVIRTAAASGLAARYLAPRDASRAAIVGCGAQALKQLAAVRAEREIRSVRVYDVNADAARALAAAARTSLEVDVVPADSVAAAVRDADVVVTCTTSRSAFLEPEHVRPGAFVAAVGADNPDKSEIAPALMASAAIVVDDLQQCATIGDLHHALEARALTRADVWRSLADVVRSPASPPDRRTVIFDSTGIPIEDVAAAAIVYERAIAAGEGSRLSLA